MRLPDVHLPRPDNRSIVLFLSITAIAGIAYFGILRAPIENAKLAAANNTQNPQLFTTELIPTSESPTTTNQANSKNCATLKPGSNMTETVETLNLSPGATVRVHVHTIYGDYDETSTTADWIAKGFSQNQVVLPKGDIFDFALAGLSEACNQ